MKLLKKIDKNLERWVMFLLLAGMTLVLGIQIFCRFVLNNSLTWSEELARFMFIWSTFLSIGFCLKEGISLKIDTLISLFPTKVQAVILLLGDVVMTVFFLYLLQSPAAGRIHIAILGIFKFYYDSCPVIRHFDQNIAVACSGFCI